MTDDRRRHNVIAKHVLGKVAMLCAGIGHVMLRKLVVHGAQDRKLRRPALVRVSRQVEIRNIVSSQPPMTIGAWTRWDCIAYPSIVSLAGGCVEVGHHRRTCLQRVSVAFVVLLGHVPGLDSAGRQGMLVRYSQPKEWY